MKPKAYIIAGEDIPSTEYNSIIKKFNSTMVQLNGKFSIPAIVENMFKGEKPTTKRKIAIVMAATFIAMNESDYSKNYASMAACIY